LLWFLIGMSSRMRSEGLVAPPATTRVALSCCAAL
jgi:hypothetical protein